MSSAITWGIVILIVLPLLFAAYAWHFHKSRHVLEAWADRHGYELLRSQRRWLRHGPFRWRTGHGHVVFYVILRDRDGVKRAAFIRCGHWLWGMFQHKVDVRWTNGRASRRRRYHE